MFAYRAAICTVQLGWQSAQRLAVADALGVPVTGLRQLLGTGGPTKIVHDVAFDARLLAEAGIALGNVHDTAIAARMLGRTATGLGSLLASELERPHRQGDAASRLGASDRSTPRCWPTWPPTWRISRRWKLRSGAR